MPQITASTSEYVMNARTSVWRTLLATMTKIDMYETSSGTFFNARSSSSVWLSERASRTTLRSAHARNIASATWIGVRRSRGASLGPDANARIHTPKTKGRKIRSSFMSIGVEKARAPLSNGTSHSIAMNAATIHGIARVVCGQSSPGACASATGPGDPAAASRRRRPTRRGGAGPGPGGSGRGPPAAPPDEAEEREQEHGRQPERGDERLPADDQAGVPA